MRIDVDRDADALYVSFGTARPARTVLLDEGTVVDVDEDGRLLGIEVICVHRDWAPQLEQILGDHHIDGADAAELRALANR